MNLVSLTLHVQDERPSLALDIATQVVVVLKLKLRGEGNFNRQFRVSRDNSLHWSHFERVTKVWVTAHALFSEVECERNVLLVNDFN